MFARRRAGRLAGRAAAADQSTATLDEALLATGFPPDLRGQETALDWWRYFSLHAQSLRRTGSTAINLAYVAAGRFDGYWAFDNHVWDVAGGMVLVREAGGLITNVDGSPYDPYSTTPWPATARCTRRCWRRCGPDRNKRRRAGGVSPRRWFCRLHRASGG